MKTSVIEIADMLSVLTVDEVEKRFGEVPGVESATVNYAAGNATVRYDETVLEAADIRVIVRQRGQHSAGKSQGKGMAEDKPAHEHAVEHAPEAASASASPPKDTPATPLTVPESAAPPVEGQDAKPPSGAQAPPSAEPAPDA